jgi:hypothetical protein
LNEQQQSLWESSGRSFLVLAGIAWEILVNSVEQDVDRVEHDSVTTVRYEDFLEDPLGEIRSLCDFSGLEFDSGFADKIGSSRIYSSRKQAFMTDLSSAQLQELATCIAATLARYGYSDAA